MTLLSETAPQSTAQDRGRLVVRMALRAFSDGTQAAAWLSRPNDMFDGHSPLFAAITSTTGCARVCQYLDELAID